MIRNTLWPLLSRTLAHYGITSWRIKRRDSSRHVAQRAQNSPQTERADQVEIDSWLTGFCVARYYDDSALEYGRDGGIRNCTFDGDAGAPSYRNASIVLVGGPRGRTPKRPHSPTSSPDRNTRSYACLTALYIVPSSSTGMEGLRGLCKRTHRETATLPVSSSATRQRSAEDRHRC